jgi:transposase
VPKWRGAPGAARLVLVVLPKQISTGDRTILGGISRRGNRYLRTLFVQGARSVLFRHKSWTKYGLARWLTDAARRLHKNVLAIALANKLARIAWAAEAIAEAVQRPTMRFVALKSTEQLDLQSLHRVRSRLVGQRTAVINQIRGFLLEHGITARSFWDHAAPAANSGSYQLPR